MTRTTRNIIDLMAGRGVRPSTQRIAVLRYLMEHPVHPTAEEIHHGLLHEIPTLSLTTVYNTLKLMAAHSIVDVLLFDPRNAHFDYPAQPHAHAWCKECGKITDIPIDPALTAAPRAADFSIEEIGLFYKGRCTECQKRTDKTQI